MLLNTSQQIPNSLERYDVCIVGSGPAGITLAREISRAGLRVCLLESGGQKSSEKSEDLNSGAVDSVHGYEEQTLLHGRCRRFGGTSNLWNHKVRGGSAAYIRYVPLDEIDFERRDWVPESGWPFSRREIQSFYELAQQVCGLGKLDFPAFESNTKESQLWQTDKIESVFSQFGSSEIFLQQHRRELYRDERVTLILQAVLLRLQMDPLSRAITAVQASLPGGREFQVKAKVFVLAAGGLENPRILLLQDNLQPGGLGNQHDMVGRCFMDHPQVKLGTLTPSSSAVFRRARFYDQHEVGGQSTMFKLHIRPEVMRREKMLNLCAVLVPYFKDLRSGGTAVLHQLLFRGPRFLLRHRSAKLDSEQIGPETSRSLRQRLLEDYYSEGCCGWSKLSGFEHRFAQFGIRSLVEQAPDRSNRIVLQEQTDAYGQRKIKVLWRWNELDLRSIRQAQKIFGEELEAAGIGNFIPVEENAGSRPRQFSSPHHFLGTTRMHQNPRNGVVDADCRVHGVPNLFISGSSVFPTGGFANPTLTVVALALRLANHLRSELGSSLNIETQPASTRTIGTVVS
jgi:choline dehydrogenase-like flavoprotein